MIRPNPPSLFITGATGLLGRAVLREFAGNGYPATGLAFHREAPCCIHGDLTDTASIPPLLEGIAPEVVIHCAAERHPEVSERDPEGTRRLNVDATGALASWCASHDVLLIVISTDYVFDGTTPPYHVDDEPNPLNGYGASKLAAERAALEASHGTAAILRVPILYGATEDLAESAVTVLADGLLKALPGAVLPFEARCIRYPTHTGDVAIVLRKMVEADRAGVILRGIYHWSGSEAMTKYEMARTMAACLPLPAISIEPETCPPSGAPRPIDSHLDISRLEKAGLSVPSRPFAASVAEILAPYARRWSDSRVSRA